MHLAIHLFFIKPTENLLWDKHCDDNFQRYEEEKKSGSPIALEMTDKTMHM